MDKILILLFVCLVNSAHLHSEPLIVGVEGFVADAETGLPLDGVSIRISELNTVYTSDSAGNFVISNIRERNYIVEFSRIGYKTASVPLSVYKDKEQCIVFRLVPLNVITPTVLVTAGKTFDKSLEISGHSKSIEGRELQQSLSQTIAATLKNEAGVSITAMGVAPSRPVIRGLGGGRITFSEDGAKTGDLSGTSPDHAVAVDPFTIEKIEVVRGPKSLIGANGSSGGVVNIIKESIPFTKPLKMLTEGSVFFESANTGIMAALKSEIPLDPFAIKGDISYRKSGEISSPEKELANTGIESYSYSIGGGYRDNLLAVGASVKEFSMKYGIPGGFVGAHPNGVKIDMFRRFYNSKMIVDIHHKVLDNIELNLNRNYYRHTEYESGNAIGAEYSMWNYTGDLRFNFAGFGISRDLVAGASFGSNDVKIGGYVFSPPTISYNSSVYGYEELQFADWEVRLGLRVMYDFYHPYDYNKVSKIGIIEDKSFFSPSFSVSIINNLTDRLSAGINLSRIARHPSGEELYNEGPHLAAYSYETGNPSLEPERGWEFELFGAYSFGDISFNLNCFLNSYDYFILQRNTGRINYSTLLPIYAASGEKALIAGIESSGVLKITGEISLNTVFSYTYGELTKPGSPMPMMPPLKLIASVKYSTTEIETGLRSEFVSSQPRVDKFEQPTAGYAIFSLYGQYLFTVGSALNSIAVNMENIFNRVYRNHLSRIKSIMPEPGINLRMIYKVFL